MRALMEKLQEELEGINAKNTGLNATISENVARILIR